MASESVTRTYEGLAPQQLRWSELQGIFEAIWGVDATSLPSYPEVIGGVAAPWLDSEDVQHRATNLDELRDAYEAGLARLLRFEGYLENRPRATFQYVLASHHGSITVTAERTEVVDAALRVVRVHFPLVPQYVFVSYATPDLDLAIWVADVLEARLAPPVEVFVAKRDIGPGRDPRKTMLEEQLLRASALIAICTQDSRSSGWLWWEASSVWTRQQLVAPLFAGISPNDFGGPLTLVLQGRDMFVEDELGEALQAVLGAVGNGAPQLMLSSGERERLAELSRVYASKRARQDPVRELRFKELLAHVLELKDAAFAAYEQGLNWSAGMANAASKMRTVLAQLSDESFPHEVSEYSNAGMPSAVMSQWQLVYSKVEQQLLNPA